MTGAKEREEEMGADDEGATEVVATIDENESEEEGGGWAEGKGFWDGTPEERKG